MLGKGYLGLGLLGVAFYGITAFTGYEYLSPGRQRVPAEYSKQAGGYRWVPFLAHRLSRRKMMTEQDWLTLTRHLINAVLFAAIGLGFFALCFFLIVKVTPFSIRKEIEEDQNTALAIIIASMILGISIILAAAIHGT